MKIVTPEHDSDEVSRSATAKAAIEHEDWHSMVALLALGSLDAEGHRVVDRHLATGCTRCTQLLAVYARISAAFCGAVAPTQPSALGARRVKRTVRRGRTNHSKHAGK